MKINKKSKKTKIGSLSLLRFKSKKKHSKVRFGSTITSKKGVLIFIILFASVGSYLIYNGQAASPELKIKMIPEPTSASYVSSSHKHRFVVTLIDSKGRPDIQTSDIGSAATAKAFASTVVAKHPDKKLASVEWDVPVHKNVSSDPLEPQQWYLRTPLNFEGAYFYGRGAGVKVAVLDQAVYCNHQDLQLTNQGVDFIDNDNNGCASGAGAVHGTFVAGEIAARQQNNVGITGAAPQSIILPVRVLRDDGGGYMSDVARGITWSADHGARIINISLGGYSGTSAAADAVNYAWSKNDLIVAAAGNDGKTTPVYPAAYSNVIAVGSVDQNLAKSNFSNYGSWVDIFAPGSNIVSTAASSPSSYAYGAGTSFAAPFVSAELADMISQGPTAKNSDLRKVLEAAVTDLGAQGVDSVYGHGLINPFVAQQFIYNVNH